MPRPIIMSVKADIVALREIIVGEVTSAAAEKHSGARGVAVARYGRPQTAFSKQLAYLIAGRRVSTPRVAQDHDLDARRACESFSNLIRLVTDYRAAENELISDNLQLHRRCPRRHY